MSIKNKVTGGLPSITTYDANGMISGISTTGNVQGNYLLGNGAMLTGISGNTIWNANSNVNIATANGNVDINVAGNVSLKATANGIVAPGVRNDTANIANAVYFNAVTKEMTYAPVAATSASYAKYTRSTAQTVTAGGTNQPIICNVLEDSFGPDIAYDTATGIFTLQPNRTYRLAGTPGEPMSTGGAVRGTWQWKNVTTGLLVGANGVYIAPLDGASSAPPCFPAVYTFTPTVVTQVQLLLTANVNLTQLGANLSAVERGFPWVEVEVIAANAPFTQAAPTPGSVTRREITKILDYSYTSTFVIADNRLWVIKGTNSGSYNYTYVCGMNDPTGFQGMDGVNNAYEIQFPNEVTGTLVDAGNYGHTAYALFNNGNLYTWGSGDFGQFGPGTLSTGTDYAFPQLSAPDVAEVYTHVSNQQSEPFYTRLIVRKTDGTIWGCGYNGFGELGLGNTTNTVYWTQMTWAGTNPISVWNIGAYAGCTVVQKSDGTIWAAGYGGQGQLGNGSYTSTISTPVNVTAAWTGGDTTMRIKSINYGGRYYDNSWQGYWMMAMLLDNGTASRYASSGHNTWGSFGNGNYTQTNTPQTPTGLTGRIVKTTSVGNSPMTVYALMENGDLWAWGHGNEGEVGNGTWNNAPSPVRILTGTASDILTNIQGWGDYSYRTCSPLIKKLDGTYTMWGLGEYGCLGDGLQTNSNVPVQVRLPKGINIKMAGAIGATNEGFCIIAITDTNEIYAWGYNGKYSLDPTSTDNIATPLRYVPNNFLKW